LLVFCLLTKHDLCKGKFVILYGMKTWLHSFLTAALDVGERSASHLRRFTTGIRWVVVWVGSEDGLEILGKIKISYSWRESSPGESSPYQSLYTVYAISNLST